MAEKRKEKTVVILHPSLYFRVEGKLTEISVGTHLTLGAEQADKLVASGKAQSMADAKKAKAGTDAKNEDDEK